MTSRELKQSIKAEIMAKNDTVEYATVNLLINAKDSNMRFMMKLGEAFAKAAVNEDSAAMRLYHGQQLRMVYKGRI